MGNWSWENGTTERETKMETKKKKGFKGKPKGRGAQSNWRPFSPVSFLVGRVPSKIDYRKQGTLILTSLLEDLE